MNICVYLFETQCTHTNCKRNVKTFCAMSHPTVPALLQGSHQCTLIWMLTMRPWKTQRQRTLLTQGEALKDSLGENICSAYFKSSPLNYIFRESKLLIAVNQSLIMKLD